MKSSQDLKQGRRLHVDIHKNNFEINENKSCERVSRLQRSRLEARQGRRGH